MSSCLKIFIDAIKMAEVVNEFHKINEKVEECIIPLTEYNSYMEEMDSKYINKSIDELAILQREFAQFKESIDEINNAFVQIVEQIEEVDETGSNI